MAHHPTTPHHDDRLAVTVDEAVRVSGIGRSTLYELMRAGEIPYRCVGRRRLVLMDGLRRYLVGDGQEAA